MKKMLVASAACAAMLTAAGAQNLPTLSEFLSGCYRDATTCKLKLKDYYAAAEQQKVVCRPKDVSINEAVNETLRWLRSDETHSPDLNKVPFDDALYEATTKLYPCAPPPPPPAEPPAEQPAPASPPQ
jgi:hypothetical protein